MSSELFFIYDSHCPWSYSATPLVKNIVDAFPDITLHLLHNAYYDGDNGVSLTNIKSVQALSNVTFSDHYLETLSSNKDSTLAANLLTWVQQKSPMHALDLLQAIQHSHFIDGKSICDKDEVTCITNQLKLSPPAKAMKNEKLTKDAEFAFQEITEFQQFIGTNAIPALLLAHGEQLVLLNHNPYLDNPEKIVDAIKEELNRLTR